MRDTPVRRDADFYGWLLHQARLLREPGAQTWPLDSDSLAEELEAMARNEERALGSHLERLFVHLLKWHHQPNKRSGSWQASIENARAEIREQLQDSPSLKSRLPLLMERAFAKARRSAGAQMRYTRAQWETLLPKSCPWDFDTFMHDGWPGDDA